MADRIWLIAAMAVWIGPNVAVAQALNCNAPQTQLEMNACAERDWQDSDQVLNALWPQVKAKAQAMDADLPKAQRGIWQAMLDGQRAWLTYRDKNCLAEAGLMRGGSAEPLLNFGCRRHLTDERVMTLRRFLDGDGI